MNRPQDEVQHWRRVRKAMASLRGDERRGDLTLGELRRVLESIETLAQEREKAWITLIQAKEQA